MTKKRLFTLGLLSLLALTGHAETYKLPLQLDYTLVKNALVNQLYTGTDGTAEIWRDRQHCSYLRLADPRIAGQNGQIRLQNRILARMGTGAAGQCLTLFEWRGELETWQQPTVDSSRSVLRFPVTKAVAHDPQGRHLNIGQLQELITRFVEPRLGSLKVDLKESRADVERNLAYYLPKENEAEIGRILDTLRFAGTEVKDDAISINLTFDAPLKPASSKPSTPFTEAEQKQWQAAWKPWDELLSKAVQEASDHSGSPEVRDQLTEILLESRHAFQAGLSGGNAQSSDPVRKFFIDTWQKLAPELKTLSRQLPEVQSLRFLTFIAATDVLYELENIGRPFGLEISSEGLRRLGRLLIAGQQERMENTNFPNNL